VSDTNAPDGTAAGENDLERLRARLVEIDEELVRLVGERLESVLAIGRYKAERGLPVLDPGQEAKVIRRAAQMAREAEVDEEMVRDIIWRIMAAARDAQEGRTRWGPPSPE
jgi:chorismate mutase